MALTKRLSRVGNSTGLTFDRAILRQVGWDEGTEVEIKVRRDGIVLSAYQEVTVDEAREIGSKMVARHRKSLDKLGRSSGH